MTDILWYRMAGDDILRTRGVSKGSEKDRATPSSREYIHSGHFMVSDPHKHKWKTGYNFDNASKEPQNSYKFLSEEIDSTFTKLFECMSLAYTGCSIVSPKWKNFKGMKLTLRDKIRLNNAIWREWHNQFILGRPPFLCNFSMPLMDNEYGKPQAVVLEGKYTKRTNNAVVSEYQKWRTFFLKRRKHLESKMDFMQPMLPDSTSLFPMILDEEMLMSEFSDTLFSSLNQSFMFPNPREFSHSGVVVDAIQPGLVGLQPPLEELMDTLDSMPDIKPSQQLQENPFIFTAGNQTPLQVLSQEQQFDLQNINALQLQQESQQQMVQQQDVSQMLLPDALNIAQNNLQSQQQLPEMIIVDQAISAQQPNMQQNVLQQNILQQQDTVTPQGLTFALNPQLLNSLLQLQQQQQQQQAKLQLDQKDPSLTSLGLNTNFDSAFSNNVQGALSRNTGNVNRNMQPLDLLQRNNVQSNNSLMAVPIRLTRAVDTFETPSQQAQNLAIANSLQMQNTQGPSLIPCSQPEIEDVSMVEAPLQQNTLSQQQQLMHTHQQAMQNSLQTSHAKQTQEGKSFLQNINFGPVPNTLGNVIGGSSSQDSFQTDLISQLNSRTLSGQSTSNQQTQALELLKKVASHVTQSNKNTALFSNENKEIFQRIFGDKISLGQQGEEKMVGLNIQKAQPAKIQQQQQQQRQFGLQIQAQKQKRYKEQSTQHSQNIQNRGHVKGHTKGGVSIVSESPSKVIVGASQAVRPKEASFVMPKIKHVAVRPKQPTKIAPAPSTSGNIGASQSLLTHILTGGKYDSSSGIIIPNTQAAIKPSPPAVNTVLMQAVKPETQHTPISTPATNVTAFSGGLLFTSSKSNNLFGTTVVAVPTQSSAAGPPTQDKPLFTIGTSPDKPDSSKGNLDDKKNINISAEQLRRTNIKYGFETLHALIPSLSANPSVKVSKAAMLQKAVDFIKKLKADKVQVQEEMDRLKKEVQILNLAISESQSQLPASGVPVTRQRYDQMRDVFDDYVRERTQQNWKFWIFSIIIGPLFESYNGTVSTANTEELCRTVLSWLDRHCSLLALRPTVLSSLTMLSRITSILSDPTQVPQQAVQAVTKKTPDK